jgi:hypothetical protein
VSGFRKLDRLTLLGSQDTERTEIRRGLLRRDDEGIVAIDIFFDELGHHFKPTQSVPWNKFLGEAGENTAVDYFPFISPNNYLCHLLAFPKGYSEDGDFPWGG